MFNVFLLTLAFLGEPTSISDTESLPLAQNVLSHMQTRMCVDSNHIICNAKVGTITMATKQVVNGIIYRIDSETNLGNLSLELWYQSFPDVYTLHKFSLNDEDIIKDVVQIKKKFIQS